MHLWTRGQPETQYPVFMSHNLDSAISETCRRSVHSLAHWPNEALDSASRRPRMNVERTTDRVKPCQASPCVNPAMRRTSYPYLSLPEHHLTRDANRQASGRILDALYPASQAGPSNSSSLLKTDTGRHYRASSNDCHHAEDSLSTIGGSGLASLPRNHLVGRMRHTRQLPTCSPTHSGKRKRESLQASLDRDT
jgi:hypothetical protein